MEATTEQLYLPVVAIAEIEDGIAKASSAPSPIGRGLGHAPGLADLAIAATAQRHGLMILSRHLRHYRSLGMAAHEPFEALPASRG